MQAEQLEPLSSVMVWGKVNEHVLAGDMSNADKVRIYMFPKDTLY